MIYSPLCKASSCPPREEMPACRSLSTKRRTRTKCKAARAQPDERSPLPSFRTEPQASVRNLPALYPLQGDPSHSFGMTQIEDDVSPHHRLRRSRLGGARSDAAGGHGFCPQWQKFSSPRAHHTVVMRIMRASPPRGNLPPLSPPLRLSHKNLKIFVGALFKGRWIAEGKTEGLSCTRGSLHYNPPFPPLHRAPAKT